MPEIWNNFKNSNVFNIFSFLLREIKEISTKSEKKYDSVADFLKE